ncbi:MAG: TonB-dependent receptor [Bacteroidota bacterium]
MKKAVLVLSGLLWAAICFGQFTLKGSVEDENGDPLPGVSIIELDSETGTFSDENGQFELNGLKQAKVIIQASFIGKTPVEVETNAADGTPLKIVLRRNPYLLDQVIVQATRAGENTPFTFTNLDKEAIEKRNLGQDIPILLDVTPSVVVSSDAGAGIGYTGLRIRGTDPTRINVTINGIPLNDAESQGVFWVNTPDFAASTNDIQVQRGVGTSTNGAGAFGATINLNTSKLHPEPYGEISGTAGSFGTWKSTASFGTGFINKQPATTNQQQTGFTLDGRLSKIISDGYIDRASVDMDAYFVSAAYIGKNNSLRANVFSGHEVTYQAWNGVPAQYVNDDELRTFNVSGTDNLQELDNPHDNEVDDYRQTHYQLLFVQELNKNWNLNINGHYTRGMGFFEQYKIGENLTNDYGLMVCDTCNADTDLIRRRWLDNDFYGGVWSLNYLSDNLKIDNTLGGAYNEYKGDHFGEIIWAENMPGLRQNERYYFGTGDKRDFNIYNKTLYRFTNSIFGFVDLQYRRVGYEITGTDNDLRETNVDLDYNFFNPKLGLTYDLNRNTSVYGSFAVAHREPNRNDFTDAPPGTEPKPERLFNTELGINFKNKKGVFSANFYHMQYKDQLALTGNINDTGGAIRVNIPESFRVGLELTGHIFLSEKLNIEANATVSQNKIKNFTEYIDNWDTGGQDVIDHGTTDLAFSPDLIAFARLNYEVAKGLSISFSGKHVGEQFIDNTSNTNTVLDAYTIGDLQIQYELNPPFMESVSFNLLINNIFDNQYSANAWTYRYISNFYDGRSDDPYTRLEGGGVYNLTGFFPQAGRNFLLGMTVRF